MAHILVIGASGFLGGHLARALRAEGHAVRCLLRKSRKGAALEAAGCEIVQGDLSDAPSIARALAGIEAVYLSIHTLSPQKAEPGQGFMDVEIAGLENVIAGGRATGTRRVIYVTSVGIAPEGPGAWLKERWRAEELLLNSGLDVTVIRPGQIVGKGGRGFDGMMAQAAKRVAVVIGDGRRTMRNIALDDLLYYLTGVLTEPRAYGQRFTVGCDDVTAVDDGIDIGAEALGRPHPIKLHIPTWLLSPFASLIEQRMKMPPGVLKGFLDSQGGDGAGDPLPIRALLPRPPLPYRDAVARALSQEN